MIKFCTCNLTLSDSHTFDNRMPKRPVVENKPCNYWHVWTCAHAITYHSFPVLFHICELYNYL